MGIIFLLELKIPIKLPAYRLILYNLKNISYIQKNIKGTLI